MMKFGVLLPHGFIVVEPTELSAVVITKAPLVPLRAVARFGKMEVLIAFRGCLILEYFGCFLEHQLRV